MKTKLKVAEINQLVGEVAGYYDQNKGTLNRPGIVHLKNLTGRQGLHLQRLVGEAQRIMKDVEETKKSLLNAAFPETATNEEKTQFQLLVIKQNKDDILEQPKGSLPCQYSELVYSVIGKEFWLKNDDGAYSYKGELVLNEPLIEYNKKVNEIFQSEFDIEHYDWKEDFIDNIIWNEVSDVPGVYSVPAPTVFFKLIQTT